MKKFNRLEIVNIIYMFIYSALAIIVPLYLIEKKVDLTSIGFILSVGPLMYLVMRAVFAAVADSTNTKNIDIVYSVSSVASVIVYFFASSPFLFAIGNTIDGIRNAGFWSVIRTEALLAEPNREKTTDILIYYSNLRQIMEGLAKILAGILLAFIGFTYSFYFLFICSAILLSIILIDKQKSNFGSIWTNKKEILLKLTRQRPKSFWFSSLLQIFIWFPYDSTSYFILPLYLRGQLGFSYEQTALYLAFYILGVGVVASTLRSLKLAIRKIYVLIPLMIFGYVLMPLFGSNIFLPLLLIVIGNGCSNIVAEYLLSDQIIKSKEISTDVGLIYAPLRLVEFIFYFVAGILAVHFGYSILFWICGLSVSLLVIFAKETIWKINDLA